MLPELEDLNKKELAFAMLSTRLHDREEGTMDEAMAKEIAMKTSEYSHAINVGLKAYSAIEYTTDPNAKARAKARIGYAYDFLSLLIDIVKVMEVDHPAKEEAARRFDLLEDFLLQKENLVASTYLEAAKMELAAFHDPAVRDALEEKLARMIRERTG